MKRLEQAELLLRKAAQDEEVLALMGRSNGSDEVFGFHAQQAVEKLLKALLSSREVRFRKTHDLQELNELALAEGLCAPIDAESLNELTDFGAVYRYEEYEAGLALNREAIQARLQTLRSWIEAALRSEIS